MPQSLLERSRPFVEFLDEWTQALPSVDLKSVIQQPERSAIISVDIINGFCTIGPLASPRVEAIVEPITRLFRQASGSLACGTLSSARIPMSRMPSNLTPGRVTVCAAHRKPRRWRLSKPCRSLTGWSYWRKNSISTGLNAGFTEWVAAHPQVDTFIVVGDCTDLCVYQLAMHLRLDANARQLQRRVIVPADAVDTYDRSVETAQKEGGLPHAADLHHAFFLYHMALNGIEVVKELV